MTGLAAAGIAALTCWLSGSLALVATYLGQRLGAALHGVLIGMFFRMGLPLVVGFVLQKSNPPLAEAGVLTMILALYLVALVTETLLSLQFVPRPIAARLSGHHTKPIEVVGVQPR
jgi:FtsH-binding integral membrane protein